MCGINVRKGRILLKRILIALTIGVALILTGCGKTYTPIGTDSTVSPTSQQNLDQAKKHWQNSTTLY